MKIVIVYESMFGATREAAQDIAAGMRSAASVASVTVANVNQAPATIAAGADVLIVGGPTHAHGMSRAESRADAEKWADDPERSLTLEPEAPGIGVREWLASLAESTGARGAAFDTRADFPRILSGAASNAIHKALVKHGYTETIQAESFLVTKAGALEPGEHDRAKDWGRQIAASLGVAVAARSGDR
ncbi:flavodoxin family protein [Glaciibacter sp. 2TAF33]|uniref:flavodoxin family protein n=1 Tax=Glaciibacter sp. 2TAF33 TaxID=3233015 RepID=UPI003F8E97E1